jgi:hypothetical protein
MVEFEKRIHTVQGNYIVAGSQDFEKGLICKKLILEDFMLEVGEMTTLFGFFDVPLKYCGFLNDKIAVFWLGSGGGDLYTPSAQYYDATFIIDKNRIGKQYKENTFRDFFLRVNAKGQKYWK